jgi:hypothetical protein
VVPDRQWQFTFALLSFLLCSLTPSTGCLGHPLPGGMKRGVVPLGKLKGCC